MVKLTLLNWSQQLSKYRAIRRAGVEQTLLIIHCTLQWLQQIRLTVLQWCCDLQHNYLITTQTTSFNSQTKSEKIFWVTALQLNTESKQVSSDIRQRVRNLCVLDYDFSGDSTWDSVDQSKTCLSWSLLISLRLLRPWSSSLHCLTNFRLATRTSLIWFGGQKICRLTEFQNSFILYFIKKMNNVIWVNILNFFLFC